MSEKAATRRGNQDFHKGVPRDQCPFRAMDGLSEWEKAWDEAYEGSRCVTEHVLQKSLSKQESCADREIRIDPIVCVLCGSPDAMLVTVLRSQTFEWFANGKVQMSAPLKTIRCPQCLKDGDVVRDPDLAEWEKLIASQLVTLKDPSPQMHTFVRKSYGMTKDVCRWLAKNIDKIEVQR